MTPLQLTAPMIQTILKAQKNEITEFHIYKKLSRKVKNRENADILSVIADDELRHYTFWKGHTGKEVRPNRFKVFKFFWIARLFGITFGIKLMEKGEEQAQVNYGEIAKIIPEADEIIRDEDDHEKKLIGMLEEEHLKYVGSVVLGLNDALVELTGTLAGLSFALQNTRLVALAGLITGIAASLSMAASEFLSARHGESDENPLRSSLYTGTAYIFTVVALISPFLIFQNYLVCLGVTLFNAVLIILIFNFYVSVAKDLPFRSRFLEMFSISMGVAALSFGIGWLIRIFLGVEV